jgi:hypothetical protein
MDAARRHLVLTRISVAGIAFARLLPAVGLVTTNRGVGRLGLAAVVRVAALVAVEVVG